MEMGGGDCTEPAVDKGPVQGKREDMSMLEQHRSANGTPVKRARARKVHHPRGDKLRVNCKNRRATKNAS